MGHRERAPQELSCDTAAQWDSWVLCSQRQRDQGREPGYSAQILALKSSSFSFSSLLGVSYREGYNPGSPGTKATGLSPQSG